MIWLVSPFFYSPLCPVCDVAIASGWFVLSISAVSVFKSSTPVISILLLYDSVWSVSMSSVVYDIAILVCEYYTLICLHAAANLCIVVMTLVDIGSAVRYTFAWIQIKKFVAALNIACRLKGNFSWSLWQKWFFSCWCTWDKWAKPLLAVFLTIYMWSYYNYCRTFHHMYSILVWKTAIK